MEDKKNMFKTAKNCHDNLILLSVCFPRFVGRTPNRENKSFPSFCSGLHVANGVLFLASDESKHMAVSELVIDGRMTAKTGTELNILNQ